MGFFSALFGGPSSQETALANQQQSLSQTMSNAFSQRLGAQNQIFQNLNNQLTPIASMGPGQRGGSPEQWAAENTLAVNNAAAAARNARQAVSTQLAGQGGGGTSGQISGIQQQIAGTLASSAENNLSNTTQENLINQYKEGNADFWRATGGEQTLGNAQDALQFGQGAVGTTESAFNEANKVNSEKGSILGDIGKLVGVGGEALGGVLGLGGEGGGLIGGLKNVASGGRDAGTGSGGWGQNFLSGFTNEQTSGGNSGGSANY